MYAIFNITHILHSIHTHLYLVCSLNPNNFGNIHVHTQRCFYVLHINLKRMLLICPKHYSTHHLCSVAKEIQKQLSNSRLSMAHGKQCTRMILIWYTSHLGDKLGTHVQVHVKQSKILVKNRFT